jgi:hypothetical protein
MFGVFCSVTLVVETGVSIGSLASVVISGLVTTVSILLFRVFAYVGSVDLSSPCRTGKGTNHSTRCCNYSELRNAIRIVGSIGRLEV